MRGWHLAAMCCAQRCTSKQTLPTIFRLVRTSHSSPVWCLEKRCCVLNVISFTQSLFSGQEGNWCSETLFNSWGCFCAGFRSHWADTFPYNLKVSQKEASMANAHKEKRRGKRSHEPGNNSSTIPPLTVTWPVSFHQVQSYRMRVWNSFLAKISFGVFLFQPKAYFLVTFPHSLIK